MRFKGDIIITDPCYLGHGMTRGRHGMTRKGFWEHPEFDIYEGSNLSELFGFTNYIWELTIYGDWSCTTYNEIGLEIGQFCADAGLVGVFLLDEVLKFNPKYDDHLMGSHSFCVTLIKDFDGNVEYQVNDGEAQLIGTGNKPFITKQTGA